MEQPTSGSLFLAIISSSGLRAGVSVLFPNPDSGLMTVALFNDYYYELCVVFRGQRMG